MPEIDFSKMTRPAIDDFREDFNELDMNQQPEIVHAAMAAMNGVNIPNAKTSAYKADDGTIVISKGVHTLTPSRDESSMYYEKQDATINNAGIHEVSNTIEIKNREGGGYQLKISAEHHGSYGGKLDATRGHTFYDVDAQGRFTDRSSVSTTDAAGERPTDQAHGRWVIESLQTLENRLGRVMGADVQAQMSAQRPPTAATSAGDPPGPKDAMNLSDVVQNANMGRQAPALRHQM